MDVLLVKQGIDTCYLYQFLKTHVYVSLYYMFSSEIIAIAADGTMTCWVPPHTHEPGHVFSQKLQVCLFHNIVNLSYCIG